MIPNKPKPEPPVGQLLWNTYFMEWILVVRYDADDRWWFAIPRGDHPDAQHVYRAQARYSELSAVKEES